MTDRAAGGEPAADPASPPDPASRPRVLATSDCERCRPGLVTQPANTLSSLAYVAAGAATLIAARRRPDRARAGTTAVGWSLVAVGVGSVAYHGPGGVFGRWLHDASLLAMSGLVALSDLHHARGTSPSAVQVAAVAALAGTAAHPRTSGAAQAATGAAALGAELHRELVGPPSASAGSDIAGPPSALARSPAAAPTVARAALARSAAAVDRRGGALAVGLFNGGLALHVAGRTGRPLCRPDSWLQAHAGWHVLSAAALWLRTRPEVARQ